MDSLISRIVADIEACANSPCGRASLRGWSSANTILGVATGSEALAVCHQPDRRRANNAFAELLRLAADEPLAARLALAALAPGLRAAARRLSARRWRDRDEVEAELVSAAWEQVLVLAGDPPEWPAAVILSRARDRVRARLAAEGCHAAFVGTAVDAAATAVDDPADMVAGLVDLAAAMHRVGRPAVGLVVATRWSGLSLAELARATGESHAALRQRRSRAERALRAAA